MEFLSWLYYGPAKLIAHWHAAGVVLGGVLIAAQIGLTLWSGRHFDAGFFRAAPVFAGLLWWIFNAYELQIAATSEPGPAGGTLRIDLMVLVPILYVLTLAAVVTIVRELNSSANRDSKQ